MSAHFGSWVGDPPNFRTAPIFPARYSSIIATTVFLTRWICHERQTLFDCRVTPWMEWVLDSWPRSCGLEIWQQLASFYIQSQLTACAYTQAVENIFIVVKELLDMWSEVKINRVSLQMDRWTTNMAGGLQSFHNLYYEIVHYNHMFWVFLNNSVHFLQANWLRLCSGTVTWCRVWPGPSHTSGETATSCRAPGTPPSCCGTGTESITASERAQAVSTAAWHAGVHPVLTLSHSCVICTAPTPSIP